MMMQIMDGTKAAEELTGELICSTASGLKKTQFENSWCSVTVVNMKFTVSRAKELFWGRIGSQDRHFTLIVL